MATAPSVLTITPPAVAVPNAPVSVAGPNVSASGAAAASVPTANTTATTQAGSAPNAQTGFSPGIARFESTSPRGLTVADAAAKFKTEKAGIRARMITNQDIYTLNARNSNGVGMNANNESMPQADVPANQNQSDASSNGVLDQRDLDAVNKALARSRAKQAAADKKQQENNSQPQNPKQ